MRKDLVGKMKTLDEVIKAFEHCTDPNSDPDYDACAECPYCDDAKGCCRDNAHMTDALHYLKVLKDILDPLKVKKISCEITCPQCNSVIAILLPESNEPLTWDELREMVGQPVWVEDNIDEPEDATKYWAIYRRIEKAQETEYALLSEFYYDKAQYGTTWQAYRKERA